MPLADILRTAASQATTANAQNSTGFYADLMADGTLSLPSDVSESDAMDAVAQARAVGSSAALLHDKEALAGLPILTERSVPAGKCWRRLLPPEIDSR